VSGLTPDSNIEDADIVGTIVLNGACLELHSDTGRVRGLAWPAGTTWDEGEEVVVLSNGRRIGHGESISAAGGTYGILDEPALGSVVIAAAQECGNDTVVLLNGNPDNIDVG
jgi:hypothetical protein